MNFVTEKAAVKPWTSLLTLATLAALSGCATGGIYKNYPGALNQGQAITIVPYELESEHGHFCVYKIDVEVDDMPRAAAPRAGKTPKCTGVVTKQGVYANSASPGSSFPLLNYEKVTVRLTRTPDGPEEVYVLRLNGGMLSPPPVPGNQTVSLVIRITESGVRAYRYDIGRQPITMLLIAETRDKQ